MRYVEVNLLMIISAILLLSSCADERSMKMQELSEDQDWAVLVKQEIKPVFEESISNDNYGKYRYFFEPSDNLIGISSTKPGPLNNSSIKYYSGPVSSQSCTKGNISASFCVLLNGKSFPSPDVTKSVDGDDHSIFGRRITISISPLTKSSLDDDNTVELYAPKEIEIISPEIETEDDLLPLCYFDGFKVQWNGDENNNNGVVIILEWNGRLVVGDDVNDTYIRRTCIVEDTGETILDKDLFDGIPDTAVCHLTIVRGDIAITDIDQTSYKSMVESHEFMSFILIREIQEKS